jgi:hypothetical protein
MDNGFDSWWRIVGQMMFYKTSSSAKDVSEAAFQYGKINGKKEKFPLAPEWEKYFWTLHSAALAYGILTDDEAGTMKCRDLLDRLKAAAFQYREAHDKANGTEQSILWQDTAGNQVWGYINNGNKIITGVRKINY